jgi:hypothetical protein
MKKFFIMAMYFLCGYGTYKTMSQAKPPVLYTLHEIFLPGLRGLVVLTCAVTAFFLV